jgi:CelD/BcsL family acetyltransferase involved in cellulose biosynthesis
MGPAYDPAQVTTEELFAPLLSYLREQYGVVHVELSCRGLDADVMRRLGFVGEPLRTYIARLPSHQTEAWRALDQKTRNQTRKAMRLGLEARVELTPDFVDHYFEQISSVFAGRGFALPFKRKRVEQLVEHLMGTSHLLPVSVFLADKATCIATGIFLVANQELFLWGWAHRHEYGSYCPMELLTWTAMQRAIELGCRSFDLFGGGKAKEKYGGVIDSSTVRWMRSSIPGFLACRGAAKKAYRWWQRVKGRVSSS